MAFPKDNPNEEWRCIVGFPDYFISNFGRVWSSKWFGRLLKPATQWRNKHATMYVSIKSASGKWKSRKLSHLVLDAFAEGRKVGQVCRHIDGDGTNNRVGNLSWGSQADNVMDAVRHGTAPAAKGERNRSAKLTVEAVKIIRDRCDAGDDRNALAGEYGVSKSTIDGIHLRRTWRVIDGDNVSYVTELRRISKG